MSRNFLVVYLQQIIFLVEIFSLFFLLKIFLGARSVLFIPREAGQLWPNRKKQTDEAEYQRLLLSLDTGQEGVVL